MRAFCLLLLAWAVAFGAADDWAKVKALKTGSELRVYKKGSSRPVLAEMIDLTDDSLIVVVKKSETAIPKDEIDRIDARPPSGSHVTKESSTKETVGADGSPTSSVSTGYSMGGKPDFQTIYRRPAVAPKK